MKKGKAQSQSFKKGHNISAGGKFSKSGSKRKSNSKLKSGYKTFPNKNELETKTSAIRLNRFISNSGVCSRREADNLIEKGLISVNGKVVTELGTKVYQNDKVFYEGRQLHPEVKKYILINKPKDVVTTSSDPEQRKTVMDIIKGACNERVYPVGRLDRNTTGVLLLTNDGELSKKLTHPSSNIKKIYHVFTDRPVSKAHLTEIANGLNLEDGFIQADKVSYAHLTDKKQIGVELHSGRNRIVRRIFEHLGYKVVKLDRVWFAGLTKKHLPRGKWRFLSEKEIMLLKAGMLK